MRIVVVGDEDTVNAFRLIGFEGIVADSRRLLDVVRGLIEAGDVAAVLVSSKVAEGAGDAFNELRIRTRRPLIMVIPSLGVAYRPVNYMAMLRAILGM